jgi:hypothetical protein
MLTTKDDALYSSFSDYIKSNEVKEAFFILVGAAAALPKYTCGPIEKGVIRDFRFYTSPDEQPFAFIINQGSLLFYLRPPAVDSRKWTLADLGRSFTTVNENPKGEWTINIKDHVEALKVVEEILNV